MAHPGATLCGQSYRLLEQFKKLIFVTTFPNDFFSDPLVIGPGKDSSRKTLSGKALSTLLNFFVYNQHKSRA